jgi:hypothetical protein
LFPLVQRLAPNSFLLLAKDPGFTGSKVFEEDLYRFLGRQGFRIVAEADPAVATLNATWLPTVLRLTPDGDWAKDLPAWKADPELVNQFSCLRTKTPAVGICAKSENMAGVLGGRATIGVDRKLSSDQRQRIIKSTKERISWVNLQFGEIVEDIQNPTPASWDHTAAVIANLDLVVSVDTSVMHLAAAMGKPVWIPLAGIVDWKFPANFDRCPFYPTSRLFRGGIGFDEPVESLIAELQKLALPERIVAN